MRFKVEDLKYLGEKARRKKNTKNKNICIQKKKILIISFSRK